MWIRLAKLSDAAAIAEIYNYEVVSGVATFDLVPKSLEDSEIGCVIARGPFLASSQSRMTK